MTTVERALEIAKDEKFQWSMAHPQGWEFIVACRGYRRPYAAYVWELAYCEARLERAEERGLAETSQIGLIYTGPFKGRPRNFTEND
jgi:hypothetical protein